MSKFKAHRTLETATSEGDSVRRFFGNAEADRLARLGALCHSLPSDDITNFKNASRDLRTIAEYLIDEVNHLTPSRFGKSPLKRVREGQRLGAMPTVKEKGVHDFCWNKSHWSCRTCFFGTGNPSGLGVQARQRKGPPAFKGLLKDAKNHKLWIASFSDGGVMLFCSNCYHYASPHPRLLAHECRGKVDIHRSSEEFYLKRNMHPVSKFRFSRPFRVA